ncbi:MAG TPA: aspartyl-phosphate phosphatase Spo0E family protein [Niallia sp.]|nr:aspartyl-phosphate phosphatase Spo0E family protein [Niallia sp.]
MVINRNNMENIVEVLNQIEHLKKLLLQYGVNHGLNHPVTIKVSEQLDAYIVTYQKLTSK